MQTNRFNSFFSAAIISACIPAHASLIYQEDFSAPSTFNSANPYIGGFYGSPLAFQQIALPSGRTAITAEELVITNTASSAHRGAAIVIDPALFSGPGMYQLSYDIPAGTFAGGDTANVQIWEGSGYEFASSPNALIVDTLSGSFRPQGSAIVSLLADASPASTGTDFTIDFNFDGTSAIGIFLGLQNSDGFPFSSVNYDNIRIETASTPIPEVSGAAFLGLLMVSSFFGRRRSM